MADFLTGVLAVCAAILMVFLYIVLVALVWAVIAALVIFFLKIFGIDVLGALGIS